MALSPRERAIRQRLKDDMPHYAAKCLRIRTKAGGVEPLLLNRPQQYLHERLERQRAETGKVRALVLKGRQQGCSTYVGARYYHKATHRPGVRVFILTHQTDATQGLFAMVQRYHEHVPDLLRPSTGRANANELVFDRLDSGYKIGTAGTSAVGRSQTIQLFHGSEVAFWEHAEEHAAGALQAVPDAPGTEVILESTANGIGGWFHDRWQEAESGRGDFQAIFIPWYWSDEYARPVPRDWAPTVEEAEYQRLYGVSDEQLVWRRAKIIELRHDWLFKQEYPATAAEAFQSSGVDSYIPADLVLRARKTRVHEPTGPLVIGCDPARFGADRTAFVWRRGRAVHKIETQHGWDTMRVAGRLRRLIEDEHPARVFVDVIGLGAGVVDRLYEMGFGGVVAGINSAERPTSETVANGRPANRRAEMWYEMRDWLGDPSGVDLPNEDALQADLIAPGYRFDSNGRLLIEAKEDIKKRGLRSPDLADALALTFAEPVADVAYNRPQMAVAEYDPFGGM